MPHSGIYACWKSGKYHLAKRGRVEKEFCENLDLVNFSVKLPNPLINNQIQNCSFLSLYQDDKTKASCLVSVLDNRSDNFSIDTFNSHLLLSNPHKLLILNYWPNLWNSISFTSCGGPQNGTQGSLIFPASWKPNENFLWSSMHLWQVMFLYTIISVYSNYSNLLGYFIFFPQPLAKTVGPK